MHTTSDFSTSSPTLTLFLLLLGHLKGFEMVLTAVFICISLTPNDGEGDGTPLQYSYWKIPWTEEPGGLQSMGSLGVGHD